MRFRLGEYVKVDSSALFWPKETKGGFIQELGTSISLAGEVMYRVKPFGFPASATMWVVSSKIRRFDEVHIPKEFRGDLEFNIEV